MRRITARNNLAELQSLSGEQESYYRISLDRVTGLWPIYATVHTHKNGSIISTSFDEGGQLPTTWSMNVTRLSVSYLPD